MKHTQQISEVAAILGISTERVRQLDDVLRPIRVGSSRMRLYDPAQVALVSERRSKRASTTRKNPLNRRLPGLSNR